MLKNFYNDEINLVRNLIDSGNSVCLTWGINELFVKTILFNKKFEKEWCDNAENTNFPPDFYSEKHKFMMEVMRINDHENLKGENPYYARENAILKEINRSNPRNEGYAMIIPAMHISNNKFKALKTEEDHNISYYNRHFIKTVEHHIKQIPKYRKNHPKKKLAFFIYDESCPYIELPNCLYNREKLFEDGYVPNCRVHFPYKDVKFLSVFEESDIDVVIWHMPFKVINSEIVKPMTVIFSPKRLSQIKCENYVHNSIITAEL